MLSVSLMSGIVVYRVALAPGTAGDGGPLGPACTEDAGRRKSDPAVAREESTASSARSRSLPHYDLHVSDKPLAGCSAARTKLRPNPVILGTHAGCMPMKIARAAEARRIKRTNARLAVAHQ